MILPGQPGENATIGGVTMNRQVKNTFAQLTASFLGTNREAGHLKGLSRDEVNLLEQSVLVERGGRCSKCNRPKDPDCDLCNGNVF